MQGRQSGRYRDCYIKALVAERLRVHLGSVALPIELGARRSAAYFVSSALRGEVNSIGGPVETENLPYPAARKRPNPRRH